MWQEFVNRSIVQQHAEFSRSTFKPSTASWLSPLKWICTPADIPNGCNIWLRFPTPTAQSNPRSNCEVPVPRENICIITTFHTAVLHSSEQLCTGDGVRGTAPVWGSCRWKRNRSYLNFIALKPYFMKPTHVSVTCGLLNSTSGCVFGKVVRLSSMFSPVVQSCLSMSHAEKWLFMLFIISSSKMIWHYRCVTFALSI